MVGLIPPPDPHALVPPFLACLPLAFASPRPPPALLRLVSPILRQRLHLQTSISSGESESWLKLLSWDRTEADRVVDIVEEGNWEPHPTSGEIEIGDLGQISYKRFDEETLRARVPIPDFSLTVVYVWCADDDGTSAWRIAELIPFDLDADRDDSWSKTISEANASSHDRILSEALRDAEASDAQHASVSQHSQAQGTPAVNDDDDDDYWAQYDRTPGRTPANKRSPAPPSLLSGSRNTDDDYYARYASVQPALDPSDPSEEEAAKEQLNGESTLNGNHVAELLRRQDGRQTPSPHQFDEGIEQVSQPFPSRPSSSSSGSQAVARLEDSAELQSSAEVGVRQHISTSVKSMYRLARSMGMEREEFIRVVQREMEILEMVD